MTIMGLGRFGGGVGVTRYLVERGLPGGSGGFDVVLTDLADEDDLADSLAQIQDLVDDGSVTLRLGGHHVSDFTTCDAVVVNPVVNPQTNRFTRAATAAGIPLTTEIALTLHALQHQCGVPREHIIGVTGSAGKSTTAAMIAHMLEHYLGKPNVHLGGNIGGSLLTKLDQIQPHHWIILELSSFMLTLLNQTTPPTPHKKTNSNAHAESEPQRGEGSGTPQIENQKSPIENPTPFSPGTAVITSLAPNHLDWHGTYEAYIAAKQTILDHQTRHDNAILGPTATPHFKPICLNAMNIPAEGRRELKLQIPGEHNQLNAALALTAAVCALNEDVPRPDKLAEALATFPGLPHRLQFVAHNTERNIRYYNDSKSTTPEAARLALDSFPDQTVHLILGGYDKGADFTALLEHASQHAKHIYTLGAIGQALTDQANQLQTNLATYCETLDQAMQAIHESTKLQPGDAVVLSPAAASWDQYANYEARGEHFVALIKQLMNN